MTRSTPIGAHAAPTPKLGWCEHCGEGVTDFCRGKTGTCPKGLKQPRAVTPQEDDVLRRAAGRSAKVIDGGRLADGVLAAVTAERARTALDNMDDYARMGGIVPSGAFEVLRAFIEQYGSGALGPERIHAALAAPGCERLKEWAEVGPVQRAAVERFADVLAAGVKGPEHG